MDSGKDEAKHRGRFCETFSESAKLLNALHKCFLTEISNGFTLTVCKRN